MTDYTRDFELIRRIQIATDAAFFIESATLPIVALLKLFGPKSAAKRLEFAKTLESFDCRGQHMLQMAWRVRYGVPPLQKSMIIRSLTNDMPVVGSVYDRSCTRYEYHDVLGIPVAREPYNGSEAFSSPATKAEILGRVAATASRWTITSTGCMRPDTAPVPEMLAKQTREILGRLRGFNSCRAMVLWGPPRGGKSVAARQIADALGLGWVRIQGPAATSMDVWETLHEMRPATLILDDLDACAKHDDPLLGWVEHARTYAKTIITTVNTLPRTSDDTGHDLRGALMTVGRLADERPRHYAQLDDGIRAVLAPDVPADLRPSDLLAAYLAELQTRSRVRPVGQSDVEEMRHLMRIAGDR